MQLWPLDSVFGLRDLFVKWTKGGGKSQSLKICQKSLIFTTLVKLPKWTPNIPKLELRDQKGNKKTIN